MILFPHSVENNINVLKSPCKVPDDDHDGGDDHGRFIQILSFSTDFRESPQYQILRKSGWWEGAALIHADRQTDGQI